ncbi:DUF6092 family protein [Streptomyces sp. NPDC006627]|uniref:DUF6092 family protein n=1 Tax=Streptomyces sp. NPDC006627 TaxID=3154679 RepID=UPI00339EB058
MREDLVLLAAHLLTSARGLLKEPKDYGPMRCLNAAGQVLELLERAQGSEPRLDTVRARIEDVLVGPQNQQDLPAFLDELCEELAVAVKRSDPVRASD